MGLLCCNHSRDSASAFSSSAVTGSSSKGALAMAGHRIEHGFEQADDGGELRRRKLVDQFVSVLFVGHDSSILTQQSKHAVARIPNAKLEEFPDTGHTPQISDLNYPHYTNNRVVGL
jgi:pimeloyl-ACP methyl ester carboxylesterase